MSEYIVEVIGQMPNAIYERALEKIVRCRDCVYFDKYENDEINVCYRFDNEQPIVEPGGYCAWGERRTNDN